MHRIFDTGRMVFVSQPRNHFPLDENATNVILMAGGIGVTPLMAMARHLARMKRLFVMHYSCSSRRHAGFLADIAASSWSHRVRMHVSDEGTRADFGRILKWREGSHIYACGPERYISAVLDSAAVAGFPDENCHIEYFTVPELPDYENHDFTLRLARTGKDILVSASQSATDALTEAGVSCRREMLRRVVAAFAKCAVLGGAIEHRDFVLSNVQRKGSMILCQSRASQAGGVIEIDL